ncbi:MAG TPA: quinone oxidoreductase, partial [Thermoanaerobaculia bacterium]|nr:quinone oxidoreductase [Thermoanaerobaculia bacterium]
MRAIRISSYGGPEVLRPDSVELPQPGAAEVRVRITVAGVNFIDVYQRTGRYKGALPFTPGMEGAGVVEEAGAEVLDFAPGDRVAWASVQGSYAEEALIPGSRLVRVPDEIDDRQAAAAMLQGMTAHYLAHSTYPIRRGDCVLIHAAAGGVGLLLVQMAKRLGGRVFGTVSTEEKAELAREAGADEVILYTRDNFREEVLRLTDGEGVQAVYDSVGKVTFHDSLDSLRRLGTMVLFGASSGAVDPIDPMILNQKGSLYLTRPALHHYIHDRAELLDRAADVFGWIADGSLKLRIERTYALEDAADAHRDLEGRRTTGKLLLITG